jgi:hypothetical protein
MILKNKLSLLGIIIAVTSLVSYLFLHVFIIEKMGIVLFIVGMIAIVGHQVATWWIFYRFAITRQRMKNRLQFMHQVALGVTFGFSFIYLVANVFLGTHLHEETKGWHTLVLLVLIGIYILYQENNTHNLFSFNLHKKVNQTKKAVNQYIGFGLNWLLINILWNALGIGGGLPVFAFIYVFLMLVQNSLNYTTLGQSKYWNFTYEAIVLIHLYSVGMQNGWVWMIVISGFLGLALFLRHWNWLHYKKYSMAIGISLMVVLNTMFILKILDGQYLHEPLSELIPIPFNLYLIILAIVYIINEPSFYKRLSKQ